VEQSAVCRHLVSCNYLLTEAKKCYIVFIPRPSACNYSYRPFRTILFNCDIFSVFHFKYGNFAGSRSLGTNAKRGHVHNAYIRVRFQVFTETQSGSSSSFDRCWQWLSRFPVQAGSQDQILSLLVKAAHQITLAFPWLAGQVVREGSSERSSGKYRISKYQ